MRIIRAILVAGLAMSCLGAEEISGQWTAEVQGCHGESIEITMSLRAEDGLLTGTVREAHGQVAISGGSADGDNLAFSVTIDVNGYQTTRHFRGTLEGDVIHFSLSIEDGRGRGSPVRDFEAKRSN